MIPGGNAAASEPWLSVFLSVGMAVSKAAQQGAESTEVLRHLVDGERWLESARFSLIEFHIAFDPFEESPTVDLRLRRGVLEAELGVDPRELPVLERVEYQWYFLGLVLDVLNQIGRSHGLGVPPLRAEQWPQDAAGPQAVVPQMPLTDDASGIAAELAALDDDEVLVVIRLPEDGRDAQHARILAVDELLSRRLGDVRASSSAGDHYVFAVGIDR